MKKKRIDALNEIFIRGRGLDAELGSIEVGKRADLLLLTANPLQTLDAYDRIERIILGGEVIERDSLAADAPSSVGVSTIAIPAKGETPDFTATLWYPSAPGTATRFGTSRIRPGYLAVADGTPRLPPSAPLIVLTHGTGGSAQSLSWIPWAGSSTAYSLDDDGLAFLHKSVQSSQGIENIHERSFEFFAASCGRYLFHDDLLYVGIGFCGRLPLDLSEVHGDAQVHPNVRRPVFLKTTRRPETVVEHPPVFLQILRENFGGHEALPIDESIHCGLLQPRACFFSKEDLFYGAAVRSIHEPSNRDGFSACRIKDDIRVSFPLPQSALCGPAVWVHEPVILGQTLCEFL